MGEKLREKRMKISNKKLNKKIKTRERFFSVLSFFAYEALSFYKYISVMTIILICLTVISKKIYTHENKPVLPEELKIIETLPRKDRAELNIEINKIKSEPVPAFLNREKKLVTLDFSKYQKMRTIGERYYIFLANSLEELPNTSRENGQKLFNEALKGLRSGKGNLKMVDSKKTENPSSMLEFTYEVKPEEIYVALLERATGKLARVFRGEIEESEKSGIEGVETLSMNEMFEIEYSTVPSVISLPSQLSTPVMDTTRMYISVNQSIENSNIFPIIAINRPEKWNLGNKEVTTFLNPVDQGAEVYFYLDFSSSQEHSKKTGFYPAKINIEETTIQSPKKFFVYKRGEMSTNNLAVGAYGSLDGTENRVEVSLKPEIPLETWEMMRLYTDLKCGENITTCAVDIPYNNGNSYAPAGKNHTSLDNNIYITYGELKKINGTESFTIPNVSNMKVIPFSTIRVTKALDYETYMLSINIRNPIPKSEENLTGGDFKGSFSLLKDGGAKPLGMENHPINNSIITERVKVNLNSYTAVPDWTGYRNYTKAKDENIKIEVWVKNKKVKEIETDSDGDFINSNKVEEISLDGVTILFKGKKNSPSIGIKEWDLKRKDFVLEFCHMNGAVTKERNYYKISIEEFDEREYFDRDNSSVDDYLDTEKTSIRQVSSSDENIDLGNLKLFDYDMEILKSSNETIVEWVYPEVISLKNRTGEKSVTGKIIRRDDGVIIFNKISGKIEVGESYVSEESGLVKVKLMSGLTVKREFTVIEKLKLSLKNLENNYFYDYFLKNDSLGELLILKSDIPVTGSAILKFPGIVSMETKQRNHTAFPVISVGERENSYGEFLRKNPTSNEGYNKKEIAEKIVLSVKNSSGGTSTIEGELFITKPNKDPSDYFELDFTKGGYRALGKANYQSIDRVEAEINIEFTNSELKKFETYPTITAISNGTVNYIPAEKIHLDENLETLNERFLLPSTKYGKVITENLSIRYQNNTAVGGDDRFTYVVPSGIVKKEEEFESLKPLETINFGKISYEQTKDISHQDGDSLPVIALGNKESAPKGWIYRGISGYQNREVVLLNYGLEEKDFFYPVLTSPVATGDSGTFSVYTQRGNNTELYSANEYLAVGSHTNANKKLEKIESELSFKIKDSSEILEQIRKIPTVNVLLTANSNIYFINAIYTNGSKIYDLYTGTEATTDVAVPYPTITIQKEPYRENKEHKINLLPGYGGELIKFKTDGTIDTTALPLGVTSKANTDLTAFNSKEYKIFQGIHFSGDVNIYTKENEFVGTVSLGKKGDSEEQEFEIAGASTRVKLKFGEGGIFNLGVSKWKVNTEFPLKFEFKEASGLVRKYFETKIKTPVTSEGYIDIELGNRYNPSIEESIEIGESISFNRNSLNVITSGEQLKNILFSKTGGTALNSSGTVQVFGEGVSGVVGGVEIDNPVITISNGVSTATDIKLKNGTRVRLEHVAGKLKITPVFWTGAGTDSFSMRYQVKIGEKGSEADFVGLFHFSVKTPGRFIATVGTLDFGTISKGTRNISKETDIEIYTNLLPSESISYSLDTDTLTLDEYGNLVVKNIMVGTPVKENENLMKIPLSGTIEESSKAQVGSYEKTLQLIIRIQ